MDATNSLVGSNILYDEVGDAITPLSNGNYVVLSPDWNNFRGAATWADGAVGITGTVDANNSLVGSNPADYVGEEGITAVSNGNYVVRSPYWNGNRGAATWGDGMTGVTGAVDASNSLVGTNPGDYVGYVGDYVGVRVLSNGNYVVATPRWSSNRGAATWGDGMVGVRGTIDASNSLVGSNPGNGCLLPPLGDCVGFDGITALSNGNYVVASSYWNGRRGAATWGNGTVGVTGTVDASNSLVGSNANDGVGGVAALTNGNYVVASYYVVATPFGTRSRGAATWGDGTVGVRGTIDASNSLVGSNANDAVGSEGVTALSNGNYVVGSGNGGRGAVTWGNGKVGVTGKLDASNSLVGSNAIDAVGSGRVTALSNGNYVVNSPEWNGGFTNGRGAATWGDGTIGVTGTVDARNSLIGSNPGDRVAIDRITALRNGNYVVRSSNWNSNRGAATWGDGTVGITGAVDARNSLVGSNPNDYVGGSSSPPAGGVIALSNGNYVVASPDWNGNRGAVTWGDGTGGITGKVNENNSLVG